MQIPQLSALLGKFSGSDLGAKVRRGSMLTTFGFGFQMFLRLASNLMLTRLLAPESFGLMALAMVVLGGLTMLSDIGTRDAVIRSPRGHEEPFLQTAWTIQVLRGLMIGVVAAALAWPASVLYDQPILFPLISALGLTMVIRGFNSISTVVVNRKLMLGRLTVIEILVQVVAIGVTVTMAWLLESVWALAIGQIASTLLHLVISHKFLPPFPHRFKMERETLSEILVFGRWILLATLFGYFGGQGIAAIQGFLLPIETIGFIVLANKLSWMPGRLVSQVLNKAAYPAIAEIARERPEDIAPALRKIRGALILGIIPLFTALSFLAQPIVDFLYDPRYAQSGAFLSFLALNAGISALSMPYQNVMLAVGESRTHAFIMGCSAALRIAFIFAGFYMGGIIGMLAGIGLATLLIHLLSFSFAFRRGYAGLRLDTIALSILGIMYAYMLNTVTF